MPRHSASHGSHMSRQGAGLCRAWGRAPLHFQLRAQLGLQLQLSELQAALAAHARVAGHQPRERLLRGYMQAARCSCGGTCKQHALTAAAPQTLLQRTDVLRTHRHSMPPREHPEATGVPSADMRASGTNSLTEKSSMRSKEETQGTALPHAGHALKHPCLRVGTHCMAAVPPPARAAAPSLGRQPPPWAGSCRSASHAPAGPAPAAGVCTHCMR